MYLLGLTGILVLCTIIGIGIFKIGMELITEWESL